MSTMVTVRVAVRGSRHVHLDPPPAVPLRSLLSFDARNGADGFPPVGLHVEFRQREKVLYADEMLNGMGLDLPDHTDEATRGGGPLSWWVGLVGGSELRQLCEWPEQGDPDDDLYAMLNWVEAWPGGS